MPERERKQRPSPKERADEEVEDLAPSRYRIELAPGLEVPGVPKTPFRIRSTEIYQRDDGTGRPIWKMWHFHCSPTAGENDARVPFGDSYANRAK